MVCSFSALPSRGSVYLSIIIIIVIIMMMIIIIKECECITCTIVSVGFQVGALCACYGLKVSVV